MFTLIAYAVGAVVLLGIIHAADVSRQNVGREDQRKIDAPIIAAAEKGRDTAVAANVTLGPLVCKGDT